VTDTTLAVPTLTEIEQEARRLIAEHAPGWSFCWDNAVKRAGACHYMKRYITLSRPIFSYSDVAKAGARNVILHEIAHVLAGPRANHGPVWKAHARRIGCTGDRCHSFPIPPQRFTNRCTDGCKADGKFTRQRTPKPGLRYRCVECRGPIRWEQKETER
jgi:predicted SprT family Zn-dependent metalloprotease